MIVLIMAKSSLPKYTGPEGESNIKYFDVNFPLYAVSNTSYESSSRISGSDSYQTRANYQSRSSYFGRLHHSSQDSYKSNRLDERINRYNPSGVCPTCQRPFFKDKVMYMDATKQRKAA